jgi:acetylornithine deacetylase
MAHSAYPELGESAVHKMIMLLDKLLKMDWPVDEYAGDTTLNVGQIHGGYAPNVIADHAEAQVLIRLVTDSAPVREKILEAAKGVAEVNFTLDLAFVRLKAVEGMPTMIAKFATDIPQLTNWGQPLLLGPGSIHVAHTPYEKLAKKELLESVEIYVQLAKRLLS